MRILLDTHIFLWYITTDSRLPSPIAASIQDPNNDVALSVVSIWEASIKYQIGKLPLPGAASVYLSDQRARHSIASLPVDEASVRQLDTLPALHRDPFDRMLVCQALAHGLTIATVDAQIMAYPVSVLT